MVTLLHRRLERNLQIRGRVNDEEVVRRFHQLFYESAERTWGSTRWRHWVTLKNPLDLWVYQEILSDRRPHFIVETGTLHGGSALFLASMCDMLGHGRVITIDYRWKEKRPAHPRVEYLTGLSVAPDIVQTVHDSVSGKRAMVILDSDHSQDNVLAEMRAYESIVSPGDYMIVEDTNVNGHPVLPQHGNGPMEAVADFLAENDSFEVDESREKFILTFNPRGYLRRRDA
jgi:cephalosporin hydroxylase